jgi:hypothetical protein
MRTVFSVFFAACLLVGRAHAVIVEAQNLDLFSRALAQVDSQTLVMFDVDETLLIPEDAILQAGMHPTFDRYQEEVFGKEAGEYELSQILASMEFELVDQRSVALIRSLQQRHVRTIAFTRIPGGPLGILPSRADWRVAHLKKHGIDFRSAFPHLQELTVPAVAGEEPAFFKHGVLFAGVREKGPVLVEFLAAIPWRPSKVLFLDDNRSQLESVETSLQGSGIEFVGFHYTDVERRPLLAIDERIVRYQFSHLATDGIWVSDAEALENVEEEACSTL